MITKPQSYIELTSLQVSGALSLPVILVGYFIGNHYTNKQALTQILMGNIILFGLAMLFMVAINKHKVSTIDFAGYLFGSKGKLFCTFGMVTSLIGWTAIQIHLISSFFAYPMISNIVLSLVIMMLCRRDLSGMSTANKVLLPMIIVSLIYSVIFSTHVPTTLALSVDSESFQLGLLLIIMAGSGLVFDLPTFYRFASTPKDASLSLALLFLIAIPLIEIFGLYLARMQINVNVADVNIHQFIRQFNYASILFLVMSGLFGACLNLYSASVMLNSSFKLSYSAGLFLVCFLSALVSIIDIQHNYSIFLEVINLSGEVLAIFLLTYLMINKFKMPLPDLFQQASHRVLLGLIVSLIVIMKVSGIGFFHDLFLDAALLTSICIITFYFFINLLSVKYEFFNSK